MKKFISFMTLLLCFFSWSSIAVANTVNKQKESKVETKNSQEHKNEEHKNEEQKKKQVSMKSAVTEKGNATKDKSPGKNSH